MTLSYRHGLLPFHYRVVNSGAPAYLLVWRQAYEKAWAGKITPALRRENGEITDETMKVIRDRVAAGEACLMTDVRSHDFHEGRILGIREFPEKPKGPIRIGFWFDNGFIFRPHLLIVDEGTWPGGLGASRPGGMTLVQLASEAQALMLLEASGVKEQLSGFIGLVQCGLEVDTDGAGGLRIAGIEAGWPFLHSHAFISGMENLPAVVTGDMSPLLEKKTFTTVVPVSIPPWPSAGRAAPQSIEGLTPQWAAKFFWHDVQVEGNQLRSAGLDGLLGVARGSAQNLELARAIALELAAHLTIPEKQYRTDAGAHVATILAQLEQHFGFTL